MSNFSLICPTRGGPYFGVNYRTQRQIKKPSQEIKKKQESTNRMSSNILPKISNEASESSTIDQTLNYFNCFNILKNAFSALNITIVEFYKRNGSLIECTLTVTKQGQTWILSKGEAETKEEAKCNAAKAALIVFLSNNRPVRNSKDGSSSQGGRNRERITKNTRLPDYMEEVKCNIREVVNGIVDSGKLIKDLTSPPAPKVTTGDSESSQLDPNTPNSSSIEDSKDSKLSSLSDQSKSGSVVKPDANCIVLDIKKALSPAVIEEILEKWRCFIPLKNAFKTFNINVVEFYIRNGDKVICTLTVTKDGKTWILGKGDGGGRKMARNNAARSAVKTFFERKFPARKETGSYSKSNDRRRRSGTKTPTPEYMFQVRNSLFLMAKNSFKDLILPEINEKIASEDLNGVAEDKKETTSTAEIQDPVVSSTQDNELDQNSTIVEDEVKNSTEDLVEQPEPISTTLDNKDLCSTSEIVSGSTSPVERPLSTSLIEAVVEKWSFECSMHLWNSFKDFSIGINEFYMRNKQIIECTLTATKDGETWSLGKGEGETKDIAKRSAAKSAIKMFLENKSPFTKSDKQRRRVRRNRPLPEYMNNVRANLFKLADPIVQKEMERQNCESQEIQVKAPDQKVCDEDKPLSSENLKTGSTNTEDIFKGLSDEEGEGLVMSVVSALVSSFDRLDCRDTDSVKENSSRTNGDAALQTQVDLNIKSQSPTQEHDSHPPKAEGKRSSPDILIDKKLLDFDQIWDLTNSSDANTRSIELKKTDLNIKSQSPTREQDSHPPKTEVKRSSPDILIDKQLPDFDQIWDSTNSSDANTLSTELKKTDLNIKSQSPTGEQDLHPQKKTEVKRSLPDILIDKPLPDFDQIWDSTNSSDANTRSTELKKTDQSQLHSNQSEPNELHELLNYLSQRQNDKKKGSHSRQPIILTDAKECQNDDNTASQSETDSETNSTDTNQIDKAEEAKEFQNDLETTSQPETDSETDPIDTQLDKAEEINSDNVNLVPKDISEAGGPIYTRSKAYYAMHFFCLKKRFFFLLKGYQKFETCHSFLVDSFNHSGILYEFKEEKVHRRKFKCTLHITLKNGRILDLGSKNGRTEADAHENLLTYILEVLLTLCYTIVVKKEIVTDGVIALSSLIDTSENDEVTTSNDSLDDLEALSEISSQAAAAESKDATDLIGTDTLDVSAMSLKEKLEELLDKMTQKIRNEELVPDLVFSSEISDQNINYIQLIVKKEEKYQMLQSTAFESESKRYVVVSEVLNSPSLFKRISSQGGNTEKFVIFNPGTLMLESIRNSNVI